MPRTDKAIRDAFAEQVDHEVLPPGLAPSKLKASIHAARPGKRADWLAIVTAAITLVLIVTFVASRMSTAPRSNPTRPSTNSTPSVANPAGAIRTMVPLDATHLLALTDDSILVSSDGGKTWTPRLRTAERLNQVTALPDGTAAWAVSSASAPPHLWVSSDGGKSWSPLNVPPTHAAAGVVAVTFIDRSHGWLLLSTGAAAGSMGAELWSTADGGQSWTLVSTASAGVDTGTIPIGCQKTGIVFQSSSRGWISGECPGGEPFIYESHDGGKTWARQTLPVPPGWPSQRLAGDIVVGRPTFFNDGAAVLPVGPLPNASGLDEMLFFSSPDVGETWHLQATAPYAPTAVDAVNTNSWVVAGTGFLKMTSDSGHTWVDLGSQREWSDVVEVAFVDAQNGWVLEKSSSESILAHTSDGGRTWSTLRSS